MGVKLYFCIILRATRLSSKLLEQGYAMERLKSSLKKFYGRYGDLIKQYEVPLSFCSSSKYNDNPPPFRIYTNRDLFTELDLFWLMRSFHRTFATGVAC